MAWHWVFNLTKIRQTWQRITWNRRRRSSRRQSLRTSKTTSTVCNWWRTNRCQVTRRMKRPQTMMKAARKEACRSKTSNKRKQVTRALTSWSSSKTSTTTGTKMARTRCHMTSQRTTGRASCTSCSTSITACGRTLIRARTDTRARASTPSLTSTISRITKSVKLTVTRFNPRAYCWWVPRSESRLLIDCRSLLGKHPVLLPRGTSKPHCKSKDSAQLPDSQSLQWVKASWRTVRTHRLLLNLFPTLVY